MTKLSESSEFTIPLKNLLALIGATGLSVWAYFGIIERLAFLEHEQVMHWEEITENDDWIDGWKPPASVEKNIERVRAMELQIKEMQMRLQFLEDK
tara:strand:- start:197 stop:484 length:288 start_codon:yes stop_codon:yes gene_type:complete